MSKLVIQDATVYSASPYVKQYMGIRLVDDMLDNLPVISCTISNNTNEKEIVDFLEKMLDIHFKKGNAESNEPNIVTLPDRK